MSNTEAEKRPPSCGYKHICVPFASEVQYQEGVDDGEVSALPDDDSPATSGTVSAGAGAGLYPPRALSVAQTAVCVAAGQRLKATQKVFTVRPTFLLPYSIARSEEVENARFLR